MALQPLGRTADCTRARRCSPQVHHPLVGLIPALPSRSSPNAAEISRIAGLQKRHRPAQPLPSNDPDVLRAPDQGAPPSVNGIASASPNAAASSQQWAGSVPGKHPRGRNAPACCSSKRCRPETAPAGNGLPSHEDRGWSPAAPQGTHVGHAPPIPAAGGGVES